jgi:glycosyltransferase involved in cell wall biosynthesis
MSKAVMKDLEKFTNTSHKKYLLHPLYTAFGDKIPKQEARLKLHLKQDDRVILFFGLIRKYKGLDLLIEAFSLLKASPHNKLLIAGEFYEDKQPYFDLISKYKLEEQIMLLNQFIPNDDVKYYFSAADIVALPYRSATQSGVTQVSFHFEVPTLVTNVGGLGEIIPHNVAGYVVEPNPQAIATSLEDYFENNKEQAFTEGMKQEKQKYEWSIFVNEIIALYNGLKK